MGFFPLQLRGSMQSQEDKVILEWLCHTQSHIITAVNHVTHIRKGDAAARRAISQSVMDVMAKARMKERLLSWLSLVRPLFVMEVKPYGYGCLWGQKILPSFATDQMPWARLNTHLHAYLTKALFGATYMQESARHKKKGPGLYN